MFLGDLLFQTKMHKIELSKAANSNDLKAETFDGVTLLALQHAGRAGVDLHLWVNNNRRQCADGEATTPCPPSINKKEEM